MSQVIIAGDTSGTITLQAPAVSGSTTLTLPATSGTILQSGTVVTEAQGGTGTTIGYNGFKNRIINGAMTTDQRNAGASQTFTAGGALAYAVDRWYGYCTGANVTGQQVAGTGAIQNRYKFTGAASVTAVGFGQRIEQKNSYDLAGSTCTLSADLAISATLTTVTWTAYYATTTADTFGSLASPTVTQIATGTFTVSATVTNFSANISVPSAATTGVQILFTVGALTAGLTWTIGNVQLEKGSTATSFDYRPYGTELQLCQRYCNVFGENAFSVFGTMGWAFSTTGFTSITPLPVEMRAIPTLAYTGNTRAINGSTSTAITSASLNTSNSSKKIIVVEPSVASGLTTNLNYAWSASNDATARVIFSAEL